MVKVTSVLYWLAPFQILDERRKSIPGRNRDVGKYNESGGINSDHWAWTRWEKGKFIEDESYKWSDAENQRRLGVRVRLTKYFIFFREIRYKQREHNYWIEKAGGWRFKIPFCKTYEQTRIGNWILVDLPLLIFAFWIMFSYS